jgi:hypothetical protein
MPNCIGTAAFVWDRNPRLKYLTMNHFPIDDESLQIAEAW